MKVLFSIKNYRNLLQKSPTCDIIDIYCVNEVIFLKKANQHTPNSTRRYVIRCCLLGSLFTFALAFLLVCFWYALNYDLEFKELLYTMTSPLKGSAHQTAFLIMRDCIPLGAVLVAVFVYVAIKCYGDDVSAWKKRTRRWALLATCLFTAASLIIGSVAMRVPSYLLSKLQKTTIYEQYYVDPESVKIEANGEAKNLIYIYVESLETTYTATADGGRQKQNYMPRLTALAQENLSFSNRTDGKLGGFQTPLGSGWTMSALLATTSGIPYSFPIGDNTSEKKEHFAEGLTTLGDVLEDKGYRQMFLCGSDIEFAGRDLYFSQHGNYELFDINAAREAGYIAEDYHNGFWGFEDHILFDIAKSEVLKLAEGDQPFNMTLLTVDTHNTGGYFCDECQSLYGDSEDEMLANIIDCTDRQVTEFVAWCQAQEFYEDTVIVITGDHPRMDDLLVQNIEYDDRVIYNCFLNAVPNTEGATTGRVFTSFDIFPTTLAAMGFEIEGNRLGLGVNLFSTEQTLAEQIGYKKFEKEINKHSDFYLREFR